MTLRISREGGKIILRDRPAPYWALGLFLLAGGLLSIAAPLGLDLEPRRGGAAEEKEAQKADRLPIRSFFCPSMRVMTAASGRSARPPPS